MKELTVLILAALPVFEVRASIPLGIAVYKLSPVTTIILSILGSVLPVFPILWFLANLTGGLRKIKVFDEFFEWLFSHTRARSQWIKEIELVGLTIFIAIPLPGFGIWTGMVAAYLLGIRWWPTFISAIVGTTLASCLVFGATLGVINFIL